MEEEICPDCRNAIPFGAPMGMCPTCLLGGINEEDEVDPEFDEEVGGFILLRKIGEGGFAEVYEAEQRKPVRRRVALKVLRPGIVTPQILARFEAERQALALMDHPNIASVYEAGEDEKGRPWIAMELVEGETVTDFCRDKGISKNECLTILHQVCSAVQHAHLRGVIHRDLKPSNILVAEVDGKPVPKVIDFGIARALDVSLTDRTLYTELHQLIGTPAYMSPEQASFDPVQVDGRSDIYSLGVVMYEVLCGRPPFEESSQKEKSVMEALRRVREDDPPRPSFLKPHLKGDVEWVILKAMAKDPDSRYDAAGTLAHEIERLLSDRPVEAGSPSRTYLVNKFVRRHKVPVFAAVLTVSAIVLGAVISTMLYVKSVRLGDDLRRKESEARTAFRSSQYLLGLQMNERRRGGDAIAHFCRAVRADPEHRAAASCLLAILLQHKFTKAIDAPISYPDEVTTVRMPAIFPAGDIALGVAGDNGLIMARPGTAAENLFPTGFSEPLRYLSVVSEDGDFLISDGTRLEIRNVSAPEAVENSLVVEVPISSLLTDPQREIVILGDEAGNLKVWDAKAGIEVQRWKASGSAITALSSGREASLIGYGTASGEAGTWVPGREGLSRKHDGHFDSVTSVAIPPSGSMLVSGDASGMVQVFKVPEMARLSGPLPHGGEITALLVESKYRRLVTGSADGYTRLWDAETGKLSSPANISQDRIESLFLISGGEEVIATGSDGSVRRIEIRTGYGENFPGTGSVGAASVSAEGTRLVACDDQRQLIQVFELDRLAARPFRLPPDERKLHPRPQKAGVTVKRVNSNQLRVQSEEGEMLLPRLSSAIKSFDLDFEGKRVATVTESNRYQIFDVLTGDALTPSILLPIEIEKIGFTESDVFVQLFNDSGVPFRLEIPPSSVSLPEWFLRFAEEMGGRAFGSEGRIVTLPETSLKAAGELIPEGEDETPAGKYANWLLASGRERLLSPSNAKSVGEYVDELVSTRVPALAKEAMAFEPGNTKAVEILKSSGFRSRE